MTAQTCFIKVCSWQSQDIKGLWPSGLNACASTLAPTLKRRLSPLGRMVIELLDQTLTTNMQLVVSSRHGDSDRTMRLFNQVCDGSDFSPTDFSLSVHNAIIAMHSIHTKNTHMNVALSGGEDSFALGLIEAYALAISEKEPICYMYYDQPLPKPYDKAVIDDKLESPICIALVLTIECNPDVAHVKALFNSNDAQINKKNIFTANHFIQCLKGDSTKFEIPCMNGSFYMERYYE